jgi:hypothetical protein
MFIQCKGGASASPFAFCAEAELKQRTFDDMKYLQFFEKGGPQ